MKKAFRLTDRRLFSKCLYGFLSGILLQACATTEHRLRPLQLFTPAAATGATIDETMRNRILRYRFVDIAPQFMSTHASIEQNQTAMPKTLLLNLFDDTVITAVLD